VLDWLIARNSLDDLREQLLRGLSRVHQGRDKNFQLTHASKFGTQPAIDKICDAGLLFEKVKLVLDSMEALQELAAVWDQNLTVCKSDKRVPRRVARSLAVCAQPRI
jgi:hypothetical protein